MARTNLTTSSGEPRVRWNGPDEVTLFDYDRTWGDDFERRFRVADGYVREVQNHLTGALGAWPICENLSDRDDARLRLTATPETLLRVIEREYRDRERARRNGYWD